MTSDEAEGDLRRRELVKALADSVLAAARAAGPRGVPVTKLHERLHAIIPLTEEQTCAILAGLVNRGHLRMSRGLQLVYAASVGQ